MLLSETVSRCEETCKQQIKEAIDRERNSLADAMQNQVFVLCPVAVDGNYCSVIVITRETASIYRPI